MADRQHSADALIALGEVAETKGELEAARAHYEEATQCDPRNLRAWLNLGVVSALQERWRDAVDAYDRALAIDAANPTAHYNRGLSLAALGDSSAARAALVAAIAYRPNFPDAHAALADCFENEGRLSDAIGALHKAVEQSPGHPGYLLNLALVLRKCRLLDEAEDLLREAIANAPDLGDVAMALAGLLRERGNHVEACEILENMIGRSDFSPSLMSDYLFTLLFRDDLEPERVAIRHEEIGSTFHKAFPTLFSYRSDAAISGKKLRIGYVSGDFRRHPVAFFALPVIAGHDRAKFEVFCYSNSAVEDALTALFRKSDSGWRNVTGQTSVEAATLIHEDQIDILIDLSGYSGANRLDVFAHKPAPIQASWLGYLSTTGLETIDYRICDAVTDPEQLTEDLHTELLAALPHSLWCYRPQYSPAISAEPPRLRNPYVTFGSFNQHAKISPSVREAWANILNALPDSRLLVMGIAPGRCTEEFYNFFSSRGVDGQRLQLIDRLDILAYLERFNHVDIALDTWPYCGATTTCDALYMAVPVVTFAGRSSVSRSGASLLMAVGAPELIANSQDEYVRIAANLAGDLPRLTKLRSELRERLQRSPLMNEGIFIHDLEQLYRKMWQRFCEGDAV
jgi:protein O-GlcNAc transferase